MASPRPGMLNFFPPPPPLTSFISFCSYSTSTFCSTEMTSVASLPRSMLKVLSYILEADPGSSVIFRIGSSRTIASQLHLFIPRVQCGADIALSITAICQANILRTYIRISELGLQIPHRPRIAPFRVLILLHLLLVHHHHIHRTVPLSIRLHARKMLWRLDPY